MKKLLIFAAAVCMTMTAQATILRVSNISGSGAPFSNLGDAIAAAYDGDTIMIDGSPDTYSLGTSISKRIVLMGPGYFLTENGVIGNGAASAVIFNGVTFEESASGSVIEGVSLNQVLTIQGHNIVVTRCNTYGIQINNSAYNTVVHQNYIRGAVSGTSKDGAPHNVQITNNIFTADISTGGTVRYFKDSNIAYNLFTDQKTSSGYYAVNNLYNCTASNNIALCNEPSLEGCTLTNNFWGGTGTSPFKGLSNDLQIKNVMGGYADYAGKGPFVGDDPYVISGIPAGPMVQDISVPVSVEQGKTLNVTIKLGVQK
jgi:hypothetical protein